MNRCSRVASIPFERQQTIAGSRTCGAAALTMVYRSLGLDCRQTDVWSRVAEEVRPGVKAARTCRLARDAIEQGLASAILQADGTADLLRRVPEANVRVILNHRFDDRTSLGHYSVLLAFDGDRIVLHDPGHGPGRAIPWSQFQRLWEPGPPPSEIAGRVLLAVAPDRAISLPCTICGAEFPSSVPCPRCDAEVALAPVEAIACVASGCPSRRWSRIFCPQCDWAISHIGPAGSERGRDGRNF